MSRWSRLVLTAALVFLPLVPASAGAPTMSSHEVKVRHLLELTGAGQLGKQTMDAMLVQFKSMPGLPPGFVEEFQKVAKPDDLVNLVVPVYLHNLAEPDVDAAIAFYESPAGQRWTAAMPGITSESMAAGQQWGAQLAQQVMTNLAAKSVAPPK